MKRLLLVLVLGLLACNGGKSEKEAHRYPEGVAPVVIEDGDEKLYHSGVELYNAQEYDEAKYLLEAYVSQEAHDARPMAYLILGEIERAGDRHCASIDLYEWAFARGSKYVIHHAGVNLAYACLRCDKVERAEEVTRELMKRKDVRFRRSDPGADGDITLCRATVYRRMGHDYYNATNRSAANYGQAVRCYREAIALRTNYPDLACDYAQAYLRLVEGATNQDDVAWFLGHARHMVNRPRYSKWTNGRIQDLREQVARELGRQ